MPSKTEELILAIVRAMREGPKATPELRAAVQEYVRRLKASGYPPEQVIIAVKALVAEAGIARRAWGDRVQSDIPDRVVAWCIEAYFPPQPPDPPRESRTDVGGENSA